MAISVLTLDIYYKNEIFSPKNFDFSNKGDISAVYAFKAL